jgi:hypothetical protein
MVVMADPGRSRNSATNVRNTVRAEPPTERRGRDVGGDVRGDGDDETGRNCSKRRPAQTLGHARLRRSFRWSGRDRGHARHEQPGHRDQHGEHGESGGPQARLAAQTEQRLEQERIEQERRKRAEI